MRRAVALQTVTFVLVLLAIVVGGGAILKLALTSSDQNHELGRVVHEQGAEAAYRVKLRNAQLRELHKLAAASCGRDHAIVGVVAGIIRRARAQATSSSFPDLTAAQRDAYRQAIERAVAVDDAALSALAGIDCRGVPPLPTTSHS